MASSWKPKSVPPRSASYKHCTGDHILRLRVALSRIDAGSLMAEIVRHWGGKTQCQSIIVYPVTLSW
jgi:hypothetical protein